MLSDFTEFEDIFKEASYKIDDSNFLDDTDREIEEDFTHLLKDAIGRFDICFKDKEVDFDMEMIKPALTLKEMKITTDLMLLAFMNRIIGNIQNYQLILTTADYKTYSKSSMLIQKMTIHNQWLSAIETQMLEYGHSKTVAKLNKKIKEGKL